MIKLMIFDHDMTIVDSSRAIMTAFNCVADEVGRPRVTHEQVMHYIACPLTDFFTGLLGDCKPEWVDLYREKVIPLEYRMITPFPDTGPTLTRLHEMGVILAVASNRNDPRAAMEKSDTAKYFDAIIGPDRGLPYKPHPGMLLKLMEQYGIGPDKTVYVGDSDIDIETGVSAGARAIGITKGNFTAEQLKGFGAWRTVDALGELPEIVLRDEGR